MIPLFEEMKKIKINMCMRICNSVHPSNTRHWPNVSLMSAHDLRRRPNIKPTNWFYISYLLGIELKYIGGYRLEYNMIWAPKQTRELQLIYKRASQGHPLVVRGLFRLFSNLLLWLENIDEVLELHHRILSWILGLEQICLLLNLFL